MTHAATSLPAPLPQLAAGGALEVLPDEPLARHISMGVGGPARWLVVAHDRDALAAIPPALDAAGIPWFVLGGGSNTIFADEGYPGVIIKLGRGFRTIETGPGPNELTAGAAANLSAVMNASRRAGLAGLEWAAGVPGTLGGALAGNAGTATGDACTRVARVEVLDRTGTFRILQQGDFTFQYRSSSLRETIVLSATYALTPDDPKTIRRRIDAGLAKRREQPLGKRCSGCMFKNPAGDAAGRLIDAAGLKGLTVGGARVSTEHANFIINEGQATAGDILALCEEVRRRVRERWGVDLELEIRMIKA